MWEIIYPETPPIMIIMICLYYLACIAEISSPIGLAVSRFSCIALDGGNLNEKSNQDN